MFTSRKRRAITVPRDDDNIDTVVDSSTNSGNTAVMLQLLGLDGGEDDGGGGVGRGLAVGADEATSVANALRSASGTQHGSAIESMFGAASRRAAGKRNASMLFVSTRPNSQEFHLIGGGNADDGHSLVPYRPPSPPDDLGTNDVDDNDDDGIPQSAAAAADGFVAAEGEVVEQAPGEQGAAAAPPPHPAPAVVLRAGAAKPPKNYLVPPTRKSLEEFFGTPGANDECFLCARKGGTRGAPADSVRRMMELYQELDGQHQKSTKVRVQELHKFFNEEIKAEIDADARLAFSKGYVKDLRLCPSFHPLLIWEHLYDTHADGNQMGDVLTVAIARVAESADVVYQNQYYYRELTPDGRPIRMVDSAAWKMMREQFDTLLRLQAAKTARDAAGSSGGGGNGGSGSASATGKRTQGGGGGLAGVGASAATGDELHARTRKLFGEAGSLHGVYGKPTDMKLFAQATGRASTTTSGRRGDEKT